MGWEGWAVGWKATEMMGWMKQEAHGAEQSEGAHNAAGTHWPLLFWGLQTLCGK